METLSSLYPAPLWRHFEKICSIPHPSKHEAGVVEYIVNFCKTIGLEVFIDKVGNVIVRKPATNGYEMRTPVALQAHLDMVPQKNTDVSHDFLKDPITPYIDGDWVRAKNTTLGADNGIGVAAILAVLESHNIAHGPLEALFTIDEETGMTGAIGLEPGILKSNILLNLDSEDDTELIIGCAGGINFETTYQYNTEEIPSDDYRAYKISISGLKGGHSGIDISLDRANANQLLVRYLWTMCNKNVLVAAFNGGNMRNAIPRESSAILLVPVQAKDRIKKFTERFQKLIKQEFKEQEKQIEIELTRFNDEAVKSIIAPQDMKQMLRALINCPNGVINYNKSWSEAVETSTNLSIIEEKGGKIHISCLLRSSNNEQKSKLASTMINYFDLHGFKSETTGEYPGWQPNTDSDILRTAKNVYPRIMGEKPEVKIIHAGLECGIIAKAYPEIDMISFGPTICFPHSPDERVSISSVDKFWSLLQEMLKEIPQKSK